MSIVVGTGKNARVRLNTGELVNAKTETPADSGEATTKGKGGKSGGKGKGRVKEETPKTTETPQTETPAEGGDGNENQTE